MEEKTVGVDFYKRAGSLLIDFGGDVEKTIETKPSCLVSFDEESNLTAIELLFENGELDRKLRR